MVTPDKQRASNTQFWSRLGGKPLLEGARVLEVGCGFGRLSIDMALSGAKQVIGIDITSKAIDVANNNLKQNYPQLKNIVEFIKIDLKDFTEFNFDYIVSKDTFEHVLNLDEMINAIKMRLKPGGKLYTGFGPLWNSPFGPHGLIQGRQVIKNPVPWWHLLAGETRFINRYNRHYPKNKINSVHEIGLNKLSMSDYRKLIHASGLSVKYFEVNRGDNLALKAFELIRRLSVLEEYFSNNIYCICEKPSEFYS